MLSTSEPTNVSPFDIENVSTSGVVTFVPVSCDGDKESDICVYALSVLSEFVTMTGWAIGGAAVISSFGIVVTDGFVSFDSSGDCITVSSTPSSESDASDSGTCVSLSLSVALIHYY